MAQAPKEIRSFSQISFIQKTEEGEETVFRDGVSVSSDSQRTFTDTSTTWGPGTVSGRALLALGEATIRGIDTLLILRRLATIRLRAPSLTGSMYNDLLELCRPGMYSARIAKQALTLTLVQIHEGPESSVQIFAARLCKWPQEEARLILLELAYWLREIVCPPGWNLKRLYDFMICIIEIKDEWRSFVVEAAVVLGKALASDGLPEIWRSLYCGKSSQLAQHRMLQISEIIAHTLNPPYLPGKLPTTSQLFGALVDTLIFTSDVFPSDIRSCAIKCLLDYWIYCSKSKQWEILYQVFSLFDSSHIQMEIFTILRGQLSLTKLEDFVEACPTDSENHSDLIFLLSGWISGSHAFPGILSEGYRGYWNV
ncbi:hypothetical protein MVEN_00365600 [Mycena venus]|uniref:Uncharacterized protein n=1 Tax=Mycena venus TaxID=2733690 RepID=A0A8H7DAJ7_9AGAR|nr:hypothetical protein MVEN_00365600 [Mycena venus]